MFTTTKQVTIFNLNKTKNQKPDNPTREMASKLKTLTVLPEDSGSIASTP